MNRRETILALLAMGASAGARAQPADRSFRIGVLRPAPDDAIFRESFSPFLQALREQRIVDGVNLTIDYRVRAGTPDENLALAHELVRAKVDAILAVGPAGVGAAARATTAIPIVAVDQTTDPVAAGYAATLSRPGGNVTGLFLDFPEIGGKYIQLLRELMPQLQRVAVLWDPATGPYHLKGVESAATVLKMTLLRLEARGASDIDGAFESAVAQKAQAVLTGNSPNFNSARRRIAELALKHRLPAIMPYPAFADDGGLLAYGVYVSGMYRQAGTVMAKVLLGAKPQDLPIERPTRTELAVNRKTARTLGVTIPTSFLARADRVIE